MPRENILAASLFPVENHFHAMTRPRVRFALCRVAECALGEVHVSQIVPGFAPSDSLLVVVVVVSRFDHST